MSELQRAMSVWIWLQLEHHLIYVHDRFECRFCGMAQMEEAKHEPHCQYVEGRRLLKEFHA